jgi:glycine betaine/proline transport system ATP-binding protein
MSPDTPAAARGADALPCADAAIELQKVDVVFTRAAGRSGTTLTAAALAALDAGETRAQIADRLGVVVGVAGASLAVERGEICVLMGLSGSGKSTLLRAVNGLNRVARGHVLVRDTGGTVDITTCDAASLRRVRRNAVAMVFQQFGLLPWRTVRDNVGFGLELRGEPADRRRRIVTEKLELVGLSQWADRHVSELSGGMQQRVGLARAFATDASILLMDEPFSALDPLIRTRLQDELCDLQQRFRKTILFVTHDMNEALKLGDRIAVLENGRIMQVGTAQDIMMRPVNDQVAQFVTHVNPLSVLTGAMIMRPSSELARSENTLWLDVERRYQIALGERGEVAAVRVDGEARSVVLLGEHQAPQTLDGRLAAGATTLSLHDIIRLRETTGHPVLLLDENGHFAGVCGETEIVHALVHRGRRAEQARYR